MRTCYFYSSLIDNLNFALGILYRRRAFTGPHTTMIDIEDSCDLKCIMCWSHSSLVQESFKKNRLDFKVYKKLLQELKALGTRKVSICGDGEPFLHPQISDILETALKMHFYVNVFTSGLYLENFLDTVLRLDQLILSLHAGDNATYQKVHPQAKEGSFERIKKTLGEIRDYKKRTRSHKPYVKIINVLFNLNSDKTDEMLRLAEECGIDEVLFKPVVLKREQSSLVMNPQERDYLKQALTKWRKSKIKNNIQAYLDTPDTLQAESRSGIRAQLSSGHCYQPWFQSTVITSGDVVACPYNPIVLGNINRGSFKSIWFSSRYNNFRRLLPCNYCMANAVYPGLIKFKKFFSRLPVLRNNCIN